MALSVKETIIFVAVASICTFATRLIPFAAFGKREVPKAVKYLGEVLPCAIIGVLIIYCLKDGLSQTVTGDFNTILPQIIGVAITAIIHLWRKNVLLSISAGTISYMLLIHFVFV